MYYFDVPKKRRSATSFQKSTASVQTFQSSQSSKPPKQRRRTPILRKIGLSLAIAFFIIVVIYGFCTGNPVIIAAIVTSLAWLIRSELDKQVVDTERDVE